MWWGWPFHLGPSTRIGRKSDVAHLLFIVDGFVNDFLSFTSIDGDCIFWNCVLLAYSIVIFG